MENAKIMITFELDGKGANTKIMSLLLYNVMTIENLDTLQINRGQEITFVPYLTLVINQLNVHIKKGDM